MKILFIYPDLGSFLPPHYQHGIGFLSAVLKRGGHATKLFYLSEPWPQEKLVEKTKKFDPGLVCLSGTTHQYRYLAEIAKQIKSSIPDLLVAAGGVHAMLASEEVIANPAIDLVCRGEGEDPLVDLVQALESGRDYREITNFWVKWKGEVSRNPLRPLIDNLDRIPFPDREIFSHQEILDKDDRRLSLLVGRGCPYDCSYCANQAKRDLYRGLGKYVRLRSVSNLLEEIEICAEKYKIRSLDFNDDIFTLNRDWMEEFFENYPKKFSYPFRINVHAGTVDREIFEKLASIGAEMARIGVESGSDRVRGRIMNRRIKEDDLIHSFQGAEQAKIKTWSFNMVGLPGENAEDALATYNLNRRIFPDHMQVSVFNPYPGTKLFELCKKQGQLAKELSDGYFIPQSVLEFPSLSPSEIHHWHQRLVRLSEFCRNQKQIRRKFQDRQICANLIDELYQAEIWAPVPDYYGQEHIIIYDEARAALIMHPPCKITYEFSIPARASLYFGIMMHPGVYELGKPGGVRFYAAAGKTRDNLKRLFSHHLDAKAREKDRGFFDFKINLEQFGSGKIFFQLATEAALPEHNEFNTAGFTNPLIVADKPVCAENQNAGKTDRSENCSAWKA